MQVKVKRGLGLTKYLIGTGGWTYFKAQNKPSLRAYSKCFGFVEVNSTFYEYPSMRTVERWRRTASKDFNFTVRCHQDLTHRIGLKPVDEAHTVLSKMVEICRILDAPFLHLLTPQTQILEDSDLRDAKDLLSTTSLKGVRLAWEIRSPLNQKHVKLMQDFGIVHSVDLSREEPACNADTAYTRLFGKGKHNIYQFTDEELEDIDQKILSSEASTAIVTFHGLRMSADAARFKRYIETGAFMPVTAYLGVESAGAVLQEDAKFPSTKEELIEQEGWKVIDLTESRRIRFSDVLSRIPDRSYYSTQDVTRELEKIL
jgi:uncharacterized protein YecE (DUF72 family)